MGTTPPRLSPADAANFDTLQQAHDDGNLCLVSAIRKSDQKPVALICAMSAVPCPKHGMALALCDGECGDEILRPTPLAVMIEGNPYDLYEDPTRI